MPLQIIITALELGVTSFGRDPLRRVAWISQRSGQFFNIWSDQKQHNPRGKVESAGKGVFRIVLKTIDSSILIVVWDNLAELSQNVLLDQPHRLRAKLEGKADRRQ
jgi:hypothetical protein